MKTNWTLLLTSALLLAGFVLVRSAQDFLQGLGYAFVLGACIVQFRYILRSISTHRKCQPNGSCSEDITRCDAYGAQPAGLEYNLHVLQAFVTRGATRHPQRPAAPGAMLEHVHMRTQWWAA